MSSLDQSKYIADLVVLKTKEFKEVKELLLSNEIISADAELVKTAQSIDEITHALTDQQASRLIDVLVATKEPARGRVYSKKRVEQASGLVEDIKSTIAGWTF
jgi:hypothetical protein